MFSRLLHYLSFRIHWCCRYCLQNVGMPDQDALVVYNWANLPEHVIASVGLIWFEHRIFFVFLCYSCVQVWQDKEGQCILKSFSCLLPFLHIHRAYFFVKKLPFISMETRPVVGFCPLQQCTLAAAKHRGTQSKCWRNFRIIACDFFSWYATRAWRLAGLFCGFYSPMEAAFFSLWCEHMRKCLYFLCFVCQLYGCSEVCFNTSHIRSVSLVTTSIFKHTFQMSFNLISVHNHLYLLLCASAVC